MTMEMMKKLFVTGGTGFIGSAFVRLALDEWPPCQVGNFDALTYAGNSGLGGPGERVHCFVSGDICDGEAVEHPRS